MYFPHIWGGDVDFTTSARNMLSEWRQFIFHLELVTIFTFQEPVRLYMGLLYSLGIVFGQCQICERIASVGENAMWIYI